MARDLRIRLLIRPAAVLGLALTLLTPSALLHAEEAPPAPEDRDEAAPPRWHFGRHHGRGPRPPMPPPDVAPDLTKLSPEERERFERNRKRWEALSPDEKESVRKHHEERRQRMHRGIDRAIEESGLKLTPEQRVEFGRRFMQERRKIESELREEMNRQRKEAVEALVKRLAAEFKEAPAAEPPAEAKP